MDLNNLTISDAKKLIAAEKKPTNPLEYNKIYDDITTSLVVDSGSYECNVVDQNRDIEYRFRTFVAPDISKNHFSIGLRILSNNIHLIRFDFGNSLWHTNDFGTPNEHRVKGSHVHILSRPDKNVRKNVIPIDDIDSYKNLKMISEVFLEFVKDNSIK